MKITKKLAAIFVAAFAALSLTACSSDQPNQSIANIYQSSSSSSSTSTASSESTTTTTEGTSTTTSEEISSSIENSSETLNELETSNNGTNSELVSEPEPAPSESGKILVAYFSWSGTSEGIANNIIANTGADFYRIERDTPYSDDYNTVAYGEAKDEADSNARPPLKNAMNSIDEYDMIVLCYPIWWHTCPMTVGTFLNQFDFSGKTIIPVSQSASMNKEQYAESIQFIRDNATNATVIDGVFSKDQSTIDNYLAESGVW